MEDRLMRLGDLPSSILAVTVAPGIWWCARRRCCARLAVPPALYSSGRLAAETSWRLAAEGRNKADEQASEGARFHRRKAGNTSSRKCRRETAKLAKPTAQDPRRQNRKPKPAETSPG